MDNQTDEIIDDGFVFKRVSKRVDRKYVIFFDAMIWAGVQR